MLMVGTAGSALIQACEKAGVVIPRSANEHPLRQMNRADSFQVLLP